MWIEVPECGVVDTSSSLAEGVARDRYYLRAAEGDLREVHVGSTEAAERGAWHGSYVWGNEADGARHVFFFGTHRTQSGLVSPFPETAREVEGANCSSVGDDDKHVDKEISGASLARATVARVAGA